MTTDTKPSEAEATPQPYVDLTDKDSAGTRWVRRAVGIEGEVGQSNCREVSETLPEADQQPSPE